MKQILSVFNSDSVNLYGSRFTVGALYLGLFEECGRGVPLLIAHDASKLIGWSRPLALFFEPGLTRLAGIGDLAEDDNDFEWLQRFFVNRLQETLDNFQPEIEKLRVKLQGVLQGQEKLIYTECVAFVEPGLAIRTFPSLFALQDTDGLIPMEHLNSLGPGVYQIGELTVFAHSFFRRSLYRLNTLNYPFLRDLQALDPASGKIALDPDLVGLASTYTGGREELTYWWGPKFDDDLRSIPLGVSHHEAEETERIFFGISATQFRWGKIGNYHVFEAEELRDVPTASSKEQTYGCRYVHSTVAEKTGHIEHLDGSIRMYSEEAMVDRIGIDIAHAGRYTEYTKIWRVDGLIPISTWKRMLSDYFRDNFLVGEYLGAKKLNEAIWSKEQDKSLRDEYVPFSMTPDMGVRLALSIHPRTEEANSSVRLVKPLDRITDGLSNHPYVETFTLEIKKALSRKGTTLIIPDGTRFVSFKDFYINFPLVYHPETELQQSIKNTLEAIVTLIKALRAKEKDWVVSYNIAFPLDKEREARISTLGHIGALAKWLENPLSCPPITSDGLHEWSEKVADFLNNAFPKSIDRPRIFKVLMTSGILLINRKRIESQDFRITYSEEDQRFDFQLTFDKDNQNPIENLLSEGIQPGVGWLIEESKCTNCDQPYEKCECSKILDADVAQEIMKALPFPFWTDHPL
jgi:hypothetical protein